jgi:hypothetical protein
MTVAGKWIKLKVMISRTVVEDEECRKGKGDYLGSDYRAPDAIDAKDEWQEHDGGHFADEGSEERYDCRNDAIAERCEQCRAEYIESAEQE